MAEQIIAEPKNIDDVITGLKPKFLEIQNGSGSFGEKTRKLRELIKKTVEDRFEEWAKMRIIKDGFLRVTQGDNYDPFETGTSERSDTIRGRNDDWIVDDFRLNRGDIAHRHEETAHKVITEIRDDNNNVIAHAATAVYFKVKAIEPAGLTHESVSSATCVVTFKLSEHGLEKVIQDERAALTNAAFS